MRIIFILLLTLLTIQTISAGSLSLDAVDGSWDDGTTTFIEPNKPINFYIRLINDNGLTIAGLSNGFRVYSPSSFTPLVGETILPEFVNNFDLGFFVNYFSADGIGADTVGFAGAILFGEGMPIGFNDVPYKLSTGNIPVGDTLCIDSSYFPPSGTWKWASTSSSEFPSWDGPHCFVAKVLPCLPPIISNAPISLTGSHCDVITFDFDVTPTSAAWSSNIGSIDANGIWSYAPTLADVGQSITLTVTATDLCEASVDINLTFTNEAPIIDCSSNVTDITSDVTTNFQMEAADDCDIITWSIINGEATIDSNSGLLSILPTVAGVATVVVQATDGNATSTCDFNYNAITSGLFQTEIGCVGDQSSNFVYQGQHVDVPVTLVTGNEIGGYDMLISYDNSVLIFQSAQIGSEYQACGWEYFTYRFGADGNCGSACPSGLARIVAIAETNNGPSHPDCFSANGPLFTMDFLVSNDRTLECQQVPIRFFWMDCGDNAISSVDGNTMHISQRVYDGDEILNPPYGMDISNPEYGFPTYFGAQEECLTYETDKPAPSRDVWFNNGCVLIACADSIDARGDVNLNNVSNEIADAVLLSNYFIYGLGVFQVNVEGQIASTDVNADGLTLSVADLVYMIRIILGDAQAYPKLIPQDILVQIDNNTLSIDSEIGAAFVQLEGNANIELLADQMDIKHEYDSKLDLTNLLIYSFDGNNFSGDFLYTENKILSIELATPNGALVYSKLVPVGFSLSQNYPNPFNPTTTIEFSLAISDNVMLSVYNINGQQVAQFNESYEAGVHTIEWDASQLSSGVYFYKLETSNFSDTKKMVLLK